MGALLDGAVSSERAMGWSVSVPEGDQGMIRRAAKKDRNHPEIVKALRDAGCSVLDLGAVGDGCPDLLVRRGVLMKLLEVKDGKKRPSARALTDDQVKFHREWECCVCVVTSTDEALKAMGIAAWA